MSQPTKLVNCEAGIAMGCAAYCCRLLVRLDEDERLPDETGGVAKGYVDKDPGSGLCVHWDPATGRCANWEQRPRACRAFDCREDSRLQLVLRDGFTSLIALVTAADVPREQWRVVPTLELPGGQGDQDGDDDSE